MKVIGTGLIGSEIRNQRHLFSNEAIMIIAAGVSDSSSDDDQDYFREFGMVQENCRIAASDKLKLVYLSTYSVHEHATKPTKYVKSKLRCEGYVLKSAPDNVVIRLTNVAGSGGNSRNILNYLTEQIRTGNSFTVFENVRRNFIDVEHVPAFILHVLKENTNARIFEMVSPRSYSIREIVAAIEKQFQRNAQYNLKSRLSNNFSSNDTCSRFYENLVNSSNLEHLIVKYFGE